MRVIPRARNSRVASSKRERAGGSPLMRPILARYNMQYNPVGNVTLIKPAHAMRTPYLAWWPHPDLLRVIPERPAPLPDAVVREEVLAAGCLAYNFQPLSIRNLINRHISQLTLLQIGTEVIAMSGYQCTAL